jgi:hypothetical protein
MSSILFYRGTLMSSETSFEANSNVPLAIQVADRNKYFYWNKSGSNFSQGVNLGEVYF